MEGARGLYLSCGLSRSRSTTVSGGCFTSSAGRGGPRDGMTDKWLDFRRRQHVQEHVADIAADDTSFASEGGILPSGRTPDAVSFGENDRQRVGNDRLPEIRHGHSFPLGGVRQELTRDSVAIFMLQGEPGSAAGSTVLPGLRNPRMASQGLESPSVSNNISNDENCVMIVPKGCHRHRYIEGEPFSSTHADAKIRAGWLQQIESPDAVSTTGNVSLRLVFRRS